MFDQRFDGTHLAETRCHNYRHAVAEAIDDCGPVTLEADPLRDGERRDQAELMLFWEDLAGVSYVLWCANDMRYFPLHVGVNTVGRYPNNDIVLDDDAVSRRHCVLLVHAHGGCEVHDTASRNGTRINGRRIHKSSLATGDTLHLAGLRFRLLTRGVLVQHVGAEEECATTAAERASYLA